jgi:hypothetical protein
MALGLADTPPVTFYLHALNSCLLRKWIKPPPPIVPTSEFGEFYFPALFTSLVDCLLLSLPPKTRDQR